MPVGTEPQGQARMLVLRADVVLAAAKSNDDEGEGRSHGGGVGADPGSYGYYLGRGFSAVGKLSSISIGKYEVRTRGDKTRSPPWASQVAKVDGYLRPQGLTSQSRSADVQLLPSAQGLPEVREGEVDGGRWMVDGGLNLPCERGRGRKGVGPGFVWKGEGVP
ncbi:hypothetical protein LZ30DRAFT_771187 [Colletotrichum cereale]|nr:hypothetical protein LZ30DRAFT_771187 [Colletotrichum cereale]